MHTGLGIEQAFIETDVDDICAVFNLLPRERERTFEVIFLDELFEFRRAHHVGAFADHRKLTR